MQVKLTLRPGQPGTVRLTKKYGEHLIAVRYRYDKASQKRYKTVELIVETIDWNQDKDTQVIEEALSNKEEETNDTNFDDLNEGDNEWEETPLSEEERLPTTKEAQPQLHSQPIENAPSPSKAPHEEPQETTPVQFTQSSKGNPPDLSDIIDVSPLPKTPQPPSEAPPEKQEQQKPRELQNRRQKDTQPQPTVLPKTTAPQASLTRPRSEDLQTPVSLEPTVSIWIKREEWELLETFEKNGGHFSKEHKAWRAPISLIQKLGLDNRIL